MAAALTLRDLVTRARHLLDDLPGDVADPCAWEEDDTGLLWSNAQLVYWCNEAEQEFARRRPIEDEDTAAICQISVVASTATYTLDPRILYVDRAKLAAEDRQLEKTSSLELDEWKLDWEDLEATPTHYVEDRTGHKLRLYPTPDAADTLNLVVGRLPLTDMLWTQRYTVNPEIQAHHHMELLDWVAHRAYLKRDSETYDPAKSATHLGLFESRVGPRPSAALEQARRHNRNRRGRVRPQFF